MNEREAIVAWLREAASQCDCFARSAGECACGAWFQEPGERSFKQVYVEDIAEAIERGDHLKGQTDDR